MAFGECYCKMSMYVSIHCASNWKFKDFVVVVFGAPDLAVGWGEMQPGVGAHQRAWVILFGL